MVQVMNCATQGFINIIHQKCFETSVSIVGHGWKRYVTIFYTYCYTNKKVQHDKRINLHASKYYYVIIKCTQTHMSILTTLYRMMQIYPSDDNQFIASADYVT